VTATLQRAIVSPATAWLLPRLAALPKLPKLPQLLPAAAQFATVGPYTLDWVTQQYKCWISQWITFALLAALQAVNLFWLFLIMRIMWRVARSFGEVREDERSEYGSDEDDVDEDEELVPRVVEEDEPLEKALLDAKMAVNGVARAEHGLLAE
jgi:acyl-CoA-dependent ceramide synthase